ncbi:MAG: putative quinol monooxygenase [Vicinamibacterales bacterium]
MPASVFVVVRFRAKDGQADELRRALSKLVPPTRREPGCVQYDLLESPADPRDLCIFERWESEQALQQHVQGAELQRMLGEARAFIDGAPEAGRYRMVAV